MPIPAADATPHNRPTCIEKYAPARAPPCDDGWDELTDPALSNCERHAPPAPDSCNHARYRLPITVPPIRWCELHKSHPTSLPARSSPPAATNSTSYPRSDARSVCPSCNAPTPCPPSKQSRSPSTASSCAVLLLSRFGAALSRSPPITPRVCVSALLPAKGCSRPSIALRDIPAIRSPPHSARLSARVLSITRPAYRPSSC